MTDATPYSVPKEPGRWRAITLALVMHALLVAVLWFSVRWQNETPVAVEAEVWSPEVREAAPPPVVQPEPQPEPEPVKPEPAPPAPTVEEPRIDPDIALQAEKKRKEKLKREEEEREEKALAKRAEKAAEKQRIEKQKAEDLAKKRAAEDAKKLADTKNKADQAKLDKIHKADLDRMLAQAGTGSVSSTGKAAQSAAPSRGDGGYAARLGAKIKSNTTFYVPENLPGNPSVEYAVNLLPDGSVRRPIQKVKSSGVPGFDEAVYAAIEKSQPFPADKNGSVPSSITISQKPKAD